MEERVPSRRSEVPVETREAAEVVEALIQAYGKLVFHVVYGLTGNWEESQDLTQETFLYALRGIDAARTASGSHFQAKAWLVRNAINAVRMHRRQYRTKVVSFAELQSEQDLVGPTDDVPIAAQEDIQGADDPATLLAERDLVQRCLAHLPETLRLPLLLSLVGGFSSREIARMLDLKEAAVRQRVTRARKAFQHAYTHESGEQLQAEEAASRSTELVFRPRGRWEHRSPALAPAP